MPRRLAKPPKQEIPLEERLAECDSSELIAIIAELTGRDRSAARYVERYLDRPTALDLPYYRRWFSSALGRRNWIPYKEARAFVGDVNLVISSMASLLKQGFATEVISLTEYALKRLEKRLLTLDDSDGLTQDFFVQLEELHLAACRAAPPPPRQLAKRLFEWQLNGDWDTFLLSIGKYRGVLGESGLKAYEQLVEGAWEQLPPVPEGGRMRDHARYRLDTMRKALARSSHDSAQVVWAWSDSLDSSHDYDQLVEALVDCSDALTAIEWAEHGVAEYPARETFKLRQRLAALYLDRDRGDEALQLLWDHLLARPTLDSYQALMALATKLGEADAWRPRALERLRRPEGDQTTLVLALMADGDIEHAWQEARAGGCDSSTLHAVAKARAKTDPEETIQVYRKLVWESLKPTGKPTYRIAVKLLAETRDVMERAGETALFPELIEEIRTRYRNRPTLMTMLEKKGW